jgi:uncharacterized protein YhjY with autotransporter beta-barrel domain
VAATGRKASIDRAQASIGPNGEVLPPADRFAKRLGELIPVPSRLTSIGLATSLIGAAAWLCAPTGAVAQSTVTNSSPITQTFVWPDDCTTTNKCAVIAVQATAQGQPGTGSSGTGGASGDASATLTAGGNVTLQVSGTTPALNSLYPSGGVVATSIGGVGGGGDGDFGANGGVGGAAGNASITVTNANVNVSGANLAGLMAVGQGGNGGVGQDLNDSAGGHAGEGGQGGAVNGSVNITLSGSSANAITVNTANSNSPGVYAISLGGQGGMGGYLEGGLGGGTAGFGGNGNSASQVNVNVTGTTIITQGVSSPGIVAQSEGGGGGTGNSGTAFATVTGGDGGGGGAAGTVNVSTDSASSIQTQGAGSIGILAQSLGGAAGASGEGGGVDGKGGTSGTGGNSDSVTVDNNGTISTAGQAAHGIVVQSLAGAGGAGGTAWGTVHASGGVGSAGGASNWAIAQNNGTITTDGPNAHGVLLQSIGGGGGAGGGASGPLSSVGGDGGFGANGGAATFTAGDNSSILTKGIASIGVLTQSIGGGGGDGGGASGVNVTVGGSGGSGGYGIWSAVTLNPGSTITTLGAGSDAVLTQSIGGGGGNAGNAASGGAFAAVAIGGSGAGGGNGGPVQIQSNGAGITTSGAFSSGLKAQSVGGGGGNGGAAFAGSISVGFSAGASIGGSGGIGGNADSAVVNVVGGSVATGQDPLLMTPGATGAGTCPSLPCNTLTADSYGVVVQSIGGGGGIGGSALADSVAVGVPIGEQSVAVAANFTMGGSGGSAGAGGAAVFGLSNGGSITTSGMGSTGVMVQSIGGGGGAGGDSTAYATAVGYGANSVPKGGGSLSLTATLTLAGEGGAGNTGGPVTVALGGTTGVSNNIPSSTPDGWTGSPSSITTYGDHADGILAQSIGGGGGNAGTGSGSTQGFGQSSSSTISISLGAPGGTGGGGGPVNVNLYSGSIQTYGSDAIGVLAQSVGGGGGTSQGGSLNIAQSFGLKKATIQPDLSIGLGGKGVNGADGGTVTVNVSAPITTAGGDATGVLAQSIGGGGGVGGSAGADGSADNPVISVLKTREFGSEISALLTKELGLPNSGSLPPLDVTFGVAFGGSGGTGGDGQTVTVNQNAPIATSGDWAAGIVAQSIGGGGGKGGSAAASGTGGFEAITINLDYALGGSGGTAGQGGPVNVTIGDGAAVSTQGFGAAGIIAQSVGGGGGIAADGSDSAVGTLSLGVTETGTGGTGGNGGPVNFLYNGGNPTISTSGTLADGIVLQSVGGGGGVASAGSSKWVQHLGIVGQQVPTLTLSSGGNTGAFGDGGDVNYNQANTPLTISTSGINAFGILAQSVGGGGGIIDTPRTVAAPTTLIGGRNGGNGGAVNVTTTSSTVINTTGVGSLGIFAQSVGSGGGIIRVAGYSTDVPTLGRGPDSQIAAQTAPGSGNGGNVTVNSWGNINTSGAGSVGIFAQSIGGGGGVILNGNSLYAGTPLQYSCASPCGGAAGDVNLDVHGSISATGQNGIGIFAQAAGYAAETTSNPDLQIYGQVEGGTGTNAAGIMLDNQQGSNAFVNVYVGASVTTAQGYKGNAIWEVGEGTANVNNYSGTIIGNLYLHTGQLWNYGKFVPGPMVDGSVENHGSITMVDPGMATRVTGDFVQGSDGTLGVAVDSLNHRASLLQVDGPASIQGLVVPNAITLLPGTLPVVTAGSLAFSGDARDSLLFDWETRQSGNTVTLTPHAQFVPNGLSLTSSQASQANYYNRAWSNADPGLATPFAKLSQLNDGAQYKSALDAFSAKATQAQSIAFANSAGTILGSSMSCPIFEGEGVRLTEDGCVWARVSGTWADQSSTGDTLGYHVSGTTYRFGGQHQVAPGWYVGASVAAGQTWARMRGGSTGDGDTYDGSLTLKRIDGPWQFAGSIAVATGSFNADRQIDVAGVNESLSSDPKIFLAGTRLRVGYEFAFSDWYIKPYGDVDVFYTHLPGFKESGDSPFALDVRSSNKTSVAFSPMLEFGRRVDLDAKTTLRAYAAFGMSYQPDSTRTIRSSFVAASSANGTFNDYVKSPEVLGKIDLGLQLFRAGGFEMKAGYTADLGKSFSNQTASARFAYHF